MKTRGGRQIQIHFFYFVNKLLEVKLLEVLFWGVPAAHFIIHQNHKYIVQEEGVMFTSVTRQEAIVVVIQDGLSQI